MQVQKTCIQCDRVYTADRLNAKFCSRKCQWTFENRKRGQQPDQQEKTCVWCDGPFVSITAGQIYCRVPCRHAAERVRLKHKYGMSWQKFLRERRLNKNLCAGCGLRPPLMGTQLCSSCKDKLASRRKKHRSKLKRDLIAHYGGICNCCGEARSEFMTIDHVQNNGAEHRKILGGTGALYGWLRKHDFPQEGFQLLCFNCNHAKAMFGICPHTT